MFRKIRDAIARLVFSKPEHSVDSTPEDSKAEVSEVKMLLNTLMEHLS